MTWFLLVTTLIQVPATLFTVHVVKKAIPQFKKSWKDAFK